MQCSEGYEIMKETNDNQTRTRIRSRVLLALTVAGVIALGVIIVGKFTAIEHSVAAPSGEAVRQSVPPPADDPQPVDFKPLIGRWVRTDAPYVIEITGAGDDGKLKAGYYNPRSINVSRAEAHDNDGKLKVFVELRDVNYPGSTYTLTYDRARSQLIGVYFQAVAGQKYNVAFNRLPPTR